MRTSLLLLAVLLFQPFLFASESIPPTLREVGIEERVGESVAKGVSFLTHDGQPFEFDSLFDGQRAVILNLAYYSCPMLCHLVSGGMAEGMKGLGFDVGSRYKTVTLSIDPDDTTETASAFRKRYLEELDQDAANEHWHFIYGDKPSIRKITDSVGFNYRFDVKSNEFAHSAGIIILTPEGKVSRYLYGIQFRPFDLKMALLEAIDKKYISTVDRVLLFCYNYDPQSRKYVLFAQNLMRVGGLATIGIILFLFYRLRKEEHDS
jgi:protein SCO1/2